MKISRESHRKQCHKELRTGNCRVTGAIKGCCGGSEFRNDLGLKRAWFGLFEKACLSNVADRNMESPMGGVQSTRKALCHSKTGKKDWWAGERAEREELSRNRFGLQQYHSAYFSDKNVFRRGA